MSRTSVRLVRSLQRVAWFGVLPLLASAIALYYLVPLPGSASGVPEVEAFAARYLVHVGAGSLVLFALLARYWGAVLGVTKRPDPVDPRGRAGTASRLLSVAAWVVGAALLSLATRSLVRVVEVTGSSMLPTLEHGDRILVDERAYGLPLPWGGRSGATLPRRGELVVFERLVDGQPTAIVKRVIGLPGDRVELRGGLPVVNGEPLGACFAGRYVYFSAQQTADAKAMVEFPGEEPYLALHSPLLPAESEAYVVKPGEVFVLGDNRLDSQDSRFWRAGVPVDSIVGRVERRLLAATPRLDSTFEKLGPHFRIQGIDTRSAEERVAACLRQGATQPVSAR